MIINNLHPDDKENRARVVRELDTYATRWGLTREQLIFNICAKWLDAMALDGEPRQLPLPTTDALNRLALKVQAARTELLDLAGKRNKPAPEPPMPTRVM